MPEPVAVVQVPSVRVEATQADRSGHGAAGLGELHEGERSAERHAIAGNVRPSWRTDIFRCRSLITRSGLTICTGPA